MSCHAHLPRGAERAAPGRQPAPVDRAAHTPKRGRTRRGLVRRFRGVLVRRRLAHALAPLVPVLVGVVVVAVVVGALLGAALHALATTGDDS